MGDDIGHSINELHNIFNVLVAHLGADHTERQTFIEKMAKEGPPDIRSYKFPKGLLGSSGRFHLYRNGYFELRYQTRDHTERRYLLMVFATELLDARNHHNHEDIFPGPQSLPPSS